MLDLKYQAVRRTSEELLVHLQNFQLDLRFSAGVWYFGNLSSRFHATYNQDQAAYHLLEKIVPLIKHGLQGVEAHYPNEINEKNIDIYRDFCNAYNVKLISAIPNLSYDAQFRFGSLSSPIKVVRKAAIERVKEALEINKMLQTDFMVLWPGIDGYENPFGIDFIETRTRFAAGLAEAMDQVPGIQVALEPKPYEPRGRTLYGTTPEGLLFAEKVEGMLTNPVNRELLAQGFKLVGLNPEIGHMRMAQEDLPYAYSMAMEYGRLMHTHWNSQPLGGFDQDLNVGVVGPEQAEATLYSLKMHGYQGWLGIDIWPERMPVEQGLINSIDAIRSMNERINSLDHEYIITCLQDPERYAGYLEALLIRARAQSTVSLSPLPKLQKP
ncbi:MAG: TIM barrel protein [Bacillota bacterium]|nr:TIM barrel protein [Bacillota bacterium]